MVFPQKWIALKDIGAHVRYWMDEFRSNSNQKFSSSEIQCCVLGRQCQPHQLADRVKRADSCRSCHFAHEALRESVVAAELCIVVLFAEDALVFLSTSQICMDYHECDGTILESWRWSARGEMERLQNGRLCTKTCACNTFWTKWIDEVDTQPSQRKWDESKAQQTLVPTHGCTILTTCPFDWGKDGVDSSKSSATVQKQKSRSPSSARTPTSRRNVSTTVVKRSSPSCSYESWGYTSTQLNDECRTVEDDASETHESCHDPVQEFAIQAEKAMDA